MLLSTKYICVAFKAHSDVKAWQREGRKGNRVLATQK